MKKKILIFFLCFAFLMLLAPLCIGAESADVVGPVTEKAEAEPPAESENYTFLGRCAEFFVEHKSEALGLIGDGVLFVLALFVAWRQKKKSSDMALSLTGIAANTSSVATSQGGVVDAANGLITAYNGMREEYSERQASEDERNKAVGALVLQTSAVLKILTSVYANSKNLPQGVKDLVNLEYAKVLAGLEDDELLKTIAASAREKILAQVNENSDASQREG